jgi:hypothetical protein
MTDRQTEPSDLELMMFADGELEEPKRADVGAFLASSKDARLKLKAMGIVGDFVKKDAERVATAFRADDIAASVMRAIEEAADAPEDGAAKVAGTGAAAKVVRLDTSKAAVSRSTAAAVTSRSATEASKKVSREGSANDNSRLIYALAGLAAAAAVALGVWSRGPGPAPLPPDRMAKANTDVPADTAIAPPPSTDQAVAKTIEADKSPGVEVARVNWGENKPGAVYYVPSENRGETTTVVWLASE